MDSSSTYDYCFSVMSYIRWWLTCVKEPSQMKRHRQKFQIPSKAMLFSRSSWPIPYSLSLSGIHVWTLPCHDEGKEAKINVDNCGLSFSYMWVKMQKKWTKASSGTDASPAIFQALLWPGFGTLPPLHACAARPKDQWCAKIIVLTLFHLLPAVWPTWQMCQVPALEQVAGESRTSGCERLPVRTVFWP